MSYSAMRGLKRVLKFNDPTMLSAARGRVSSLRWRFVLGAIFAVGAAFVLTSASAGIGWYLAMCMVMSFDHMLGSSYLQARGEKARTTAGVLFVWGSVFSIIIFAAMPVALAAFGGGPGRVLGVLMAASSLVSVMLFTFQAPRFMMLSAAPATLALLAMPFIPIGGTLANEVQGALGVGCGVIGFMAYITRAALNNMKMVTGWKAANQAAKERQLEAELKRAEAEEANRAKSEFLAVMTHELRTPLNAVIGYAELINEDLAAEGNDLADDALRITASARHLLGLIDQILNMSSIDAGQEGLAVREVDTRKLLDETIASIQDEARDAGNRISIRVGADAERAHTDGGKLTVAMAALVSNAVKFTSNGLIAITAERDVLDGRDMLVVAVSDTGIGIANEHLARIFQPFTQIEDATTRTKGGMGLGLSIAQRMANTLGGDIVATSELGVGSTFTLRVPLRLQTATPARAAA
jgi:signal transduction histidine kinase